MADIPSPLTYGTITGYFFSLYADTADVSDPPDIQLLTGTVTFTPTSLIALGTASTPKFVALAAPIICPVIDGYLCAPNSETSDVDNRNVQLVASDSPGISPSIQYTVAFALDDVLAQPASLTIEVTGGATADLAELITL